jgi:hypothetical protein
MSLDPLLGLAGTEGEEGAACSSVMTGLLSAELACSELLVEAFARLFSCGWVLDLTGCLGIVNG